MSTAHPREWAVCAMREHTAVTVPRSYKNSMAAARTIVNTCMTRSGDTRARGVDVTAPGNRDETQVVCSHTRCARIIINFLTETVMAKTADYLATARFLRGQKSAVRNCRLLTLICLLSVFSSSCLVQIGTLRL